jgi:hypothetical protein
MAVVAYREMVRVSMLLFQEATSLNFCGRAHCSARSEW